MDGQLTFGSGGTINADSSTATATGNTASGNATCNAMAGVITTTSSTTAAGSSYTLTITDSVVASSDLIFCSLNNGTNSTSVPIISRVLPSSGGFTVLIYNAGSVAFNGTFVVSFFVLKA